MNNNVLVLAAMLLTTPASAALIAQDASSFTFSYGHSEVHGFTANGTPYSIVYDTNEQVDKLWWVPCDVCGTDSGPMNTAMPLTPPTVLLPPDMQTPPQTPLSPVPLPGSMYLLVAAVGTLWICNRVGERNVG